jgi:hypothetical protein
MYSLYLYEGLDFSSSSMMVLWESAGIKLREAELTADQIHQIFANIEKQVSGSSNRTLFGQGKDAAMAVNQAWQELKSKVQNSTPVKNVDAAYDLVVKKIEQGLGGPDNTVNQIIQKYRTFAKAHPTSQSLIYAALIAAAGLSGAGLGSAAVLSLLKMTDKLLQGNKFSSAAYSGAKTGATVYAAGQIGQSQQPDVQQSVPDKVVDIDGDYIAGQPVVPGQPLTDQQIRVIKLGIQSGNTYPAEIMTQFNQQVSQKESVDLSHAQITMIFENICQQQLDEGVLDRIKQMASSASTAISNKANKIGSNLANKITSDKLNSAWKSAGSPTDSQQLKQFLQQQGVPSGVIDAVYSDMQLPAEQSASAISIDDVVAAYVKLSAVERKQVNDGIAKIDNT